MHNDTEWYIYLFLFLMFFSIYFCTGITYEGIRSGIDGFYAADPGPHINLITNPFSESFRLKKHILFPIHYPFYKLFDIVLPEWYAIKAVFALFGGASSIFFFKMFRIYKKISVSILLTLLINFSAYVWLFSSSPESYALQIFLMSVLLYFFFNTSITSVKNVLLLSLFILLCIQSAIALSLIAVAFSLYFLFKKSLKISLLIPIYVILFISLTYLFMSLILPPLHPFTSLQGIILEMKNTPDHVDTISTRFNYAIRNGFFFHTIMPDVNPGKANRISSQESPYISDKKAYLQYLKNPVSFFTLLLYITFFGISLHNLFSNHSQKNPKQLLLLIWIGVYFIFFLLYNNHETFIYSGYIGIPFLIFLGINYPLDNIGKNKCSLVLILLVLSLLLNNLIYITRFLI